jgi:hypothetical protein
MCHGPWMWHYVGTHIGVRGWRVAREVLLTPHFEAARRTLEWLHLKKSAGRRLATQKIAQDCTHDSEMMPKESK